ncbi:MAG: hydrogenase maturation protease [Burkholderiaceae bacterium]
MNRTLIAGVGNVFLGDDGFGVEVAQRLLRRSLPQDVQVADFGIRALDLGYALQDDYSVVILVDTVQRGGAPGTLYVIEPETGRSEDAASEAGVDEAMRQLSPHDMNPDSVLRFAFMSRAPGQRILLVGCEPESFGTESDGEGRMGLSEPVAAAVGQALELIDALLDRTAPHASQSRQASQVAVTS